MYYSGSGEKEDLNETVAGVELNRLGLVTVLLREKRTSQQLSNWTKSLHNGGAGYIVLNTYPASWE